MDLSKALVLLDKNYTTERKATQLKPTQDKKGETSCVLLLKADVLHGSSLQEKDMKLWEIFKVSTITAVLTREPLLAGGEESENASAQQKCWCFKVRTCTGVRQAKPRVILGLNKCQFPLADKRVMALKLSPSSAVGPPPLSSVMEMSFPVAPSSSATTADVGHTVRLMTTHRGAYYLQYCRTYDHPGGRGGRGLQHATLPPLLNRLDLINERQRARVSPDSTMREKCFKLSPSLVAEPPSSVMPMVSSRVSDNTGQIVRSTTT